MKYLSAKTRSWQQAEQFAQALKDERDPVQIELRRIADEEKAKEDARAAKQQSIEAALDQWIAGFKAEPDSANAKAYEGFKKFTLAWANEQGFAVLNDCTPDAVDAWVASWDFSSNTQSFKLSKVRSFFRWAFSLRKIDILPTASLRSIKAENENETQPLTPEQFEQVLKATYQYDNDRKEKDRFGVDMRAVFMVMRWTGVRLIDALMLRRSAVQGNRLDLTIKKSKDTIPGRMVSDEVIDALNAVPVRKTMHPDQFFWSRNCDHRVLSGIWTPRIRLLNKYLSFTDESGNPMRFHSHQLRDMFAVEFILKGMSIDNVSKLLGHRSIRVTEKHYAPWIKRRRTMLEEEMTAMMKEMGAKFGGD